MSVTTQRDPACVKALGAFVRCPRAPTTFTEAGYIAVPAEDVQPLAMWAQQLPPPPDVVHINVDHATPLGKGWMYRVNNKLRSVHPCLRAIRFCFPVDAVHDFCQLATGKLDTSRRLFGLEIVDTSDLQYGYTADVGVTEVPLNNGTLPHLPYTMGVVNGECWETLRVCPIVREWTHVVPDFTTPAAFTAEEPYFLQGCGSPLLFISLASPGFSQNLPSPDLASDESLKELGFWVLKGVGDKEEASLWYAIVRASLEPTGGQQEEVWI